MRAPERQMEDVSSTQSPPPVAVSSLGAARTSLADLPQPILESITTFLRWGINYDGYLCELRLVSWRFNEAVLHCLGFQEPSPLFTRQFFPRHYMSCGTGCRLSDCSSFGGQNKFYARYRLQANIQSSGRNIGQAGDFHRTLATALDMLREHSGRQDNIFAGLRSQVTNHDVYSSVSLNPVFADSWSIALCEATLPLLRMVLSSWEFDISEYDDLYHRSAWFWLRNLACFLGNIELFDFYHAQTPTSADGMVSTDLPTELPELLTTTALQGHTLLFEHLTGLMPLQSLSVKGLKLALQGACVGGSLPITNTILEACPAEEISQVCYSGLCIPESRCPSSNYSAVAELLVRKCGDIPSEQSYGLLMRQAELGATSVLRLLLELYRHHQFWPVRGVVQTSWSAPWVACVNRDLQCVRMLMSDGFFTNIPKDEVSRLCTSCAVAAARANALDICQEMCDYVGLELHSLNFANLATVDGAVPAMIQKLDVTPNALEEDYYGIGTVGQAALRHAVQLLRVENTKFLLERGVRLQNGSDPLRVEWRRKRVNEQKFCHIEKLLQDHSQPALEVEL